MGVLIKTVKASSLLEVLVASVILIIVFFIAMLSFNSFMLKKINIDDVSLRNHMEELEYKYDHHQFTFPYQVKKDRYQIQTRISKTDTILDVYDIEGEKIFERKLSR